VVLAATHEAALESIPLDLLQSFSTEAADSKHGSGPDDVANGEDDANDADD